MQEKTLKNYVAFKRLRNFSCVEVHTKKAVVTVYLNVSPETVQLEKGFGRDVRHVGHFGTGDLELTIRNLRRLRPRKAYAADELRGELVGSGRLSRRRPRSLLIRRLLCGFAFATGDESTCGG